MTVTLAIAGTLSVLVGLSFLAVARAVLVRPSAAESRLALVAYATWWGALGMYLVLHGALTVWASGAHLSATLYLFSRIVAIPMLCLAVWGITSYLAFLYSGRHAVYASLWWVYAAVMVFFFWVTWTGPSAVDVRPWLISVDDSGWGYRTVYLLVGTPPIIAAIAYLGLFRLAPDRLRRYRILLVSGSILTYVGSGLGARLLADDVLVFITLVGLGAFAALSALLAFYPPRRVRAWLERTPADAPGSPPGPLWGPERLAPAISPGPSW